MASSWFFLFTQLYRLMFMQFYAVKLTQPYWEFKLIGLSDVYVAWNRLVSCFLLRTQRWCVLLEERFLIICHHHMKLCFIHEMPLLVPTHGDLWRNLCWWMWRMCNLAWNSLLGFLPVLRHSNTRSFDARWGYGCLSIGYFFLYNIRSLEMIRPCIQGRNTLKSMKFVKSCETVAFQGRFSL